MAVLTFPNSCINFSCGNSQMGFTCIFLKFTVGTSLPYIHQNLTSHENCALLGNYTASTCAYCVLTQKSAVLVYFTAEA